MVLRDRIGLENEYIFIVLPIHVRRNFGRTRAEKAKYMQLLTYRFFLAFCYYGEN